MKASLIPAILASLFVAACEQKEETTIQTPPAEKKDTVIVTPPAGESTTEKKTEKSETTVKPDGTTTEKKTETETEQKKFTSFPRVRLKRPEITPPSRWRLALEDEPFPFAEATEDRHGRPPRKCT